MGDDIGWMKPSLYHAAPEVGETPNIDRIARRRAIFMIVHAEKSCTAAKFAFFTGMNRDNRACSPTTAR